MFINISIYIYSLSLPKNALQNLSLKLFPIFSKLFTSMWKIFIKKSRFFSGTNKFWVVQNSFPILKYLNKINVRKKATHISTFDFATLYRTIPHDLLIDVLKNIICLVFDSSYRNKLGFSQNSLYWTSKGKYNRVFDKDSLSDAVSLLIKNCYFTIGNNILKQDIGIPMGTQHHFGLISFDIILRQSTSLLWFQLVLKFHTTFIRLGDSSMTFVLSMIGTLSLIILRIYIPKNLSLN